MTDDQQNSAEASDPDELGDDILDDASFPPEHPLGADDLTRDDHVVDSVRDRDWREEPETEVAEGDHLRLYAPNDVEDDDVAELVGSAIEADDLTAEEASMHIVDEP
ncbi:MAG: hypothetical protein U0Q22_12835 [Acidimicrobiales bacterium]